MLQVGLVARDVVLVTHATREAVRAAAVDPSAAAAADAARRPPAASTRTASRCGSAVGTEPAAGSGVDVTYRVLTEVPLVGALLGDHTVHTHATMRVEGP